jgi:hypothetical protein
MFKHQKLFKRALILTLQVNLNIAEHDIFLLQFHNRRFLQIGRGEIGST